MTTGDRASLRGLVARGGFYKLMDCEKMVNIILTEHAKKRMVERGVNISQIYDCVDFPSYKINRGDVLEIFKKFSDRTLRLICVRESKFIKVLTLMWK